MSTSCTADVLTPFPCNILKYFWTTNHFDNRNRHSFPLSEEFGRTEGDRPEHVETYYWPQKTGELLGKFIIINVLLELINE
jgi:hypothetical protein